MKKIFTMLLCLSLALTGAGCGAAPAPGDISPSTTATVPDELVTTPTTDPYHPEPLLQPMHAVSMVTVSEDVLADNGTVIFTSSYQKIGLSLNGTDAQAVIAEDLKQRTSSFMSNNENLISDAQDHYSSEPEYWGPYFSDISYTPTRIDQSVLSLFCNYFVQSGGVHPSHITDSVTYDLSTGNALKLGDILTETCTSSDIASLVDAALAPMADALYFDYQDSLMDIFSVNLNSITNWYFSRTGLCFHFAPYEIAPYSSGTITATIPYEQMNDILRKEYFPIVQPEATGSLYAEFFLPDDTERFTFLAEVELDPDGSEILIHPDATVTDIRIESGEWSSDGSRYIPLSTVFAADAVGLGNGILLTADFSSDAPALRLVYNSGGQEVSAFIVYDEAGDAILLTHG